MSEANRGSKNRANMGEGIKQKRPYPLGGATTMSIDTTILLWYTTLPSQVCMYTFDAIDH